MLPRLPRPCAHAALLEPFRNSAEVLHALPAGCSLRGDARLPGWWAEKLAGSEFEHREAAPGARLYVCRSLETNSWFPHTDLIGGVSGLEADQLSAAGFALEIGSANWEAWRAAALANAAPAVVAHLRAGDASAVVFPAPAFSLADLLAHCELLQHDEVCSADVGGCAAARATLHAATGAVARCAMRLAEAGWEIGGLSAADVKFFPVLVEGERGLVSSGFALGALRGAPLLTGFQARRCASGGSAGERYARMMGGLVRSCVADFESAAVMAHRLCGRSELGKQLPPEELCDDFASLRLDVSTERRGDPKAACRVRRAVLAARGAA